MNPINAFKKWLVNILVKYIEGIKKKKENKKLVIITEIFFSSYFMG